MAASRRRRRPDRDAEADGDGAPEARDAREKRRRGSQLTISGRRLRPAGARPAPGHLPAPRSGVRATVRELIRWTRGHCGPLEEFVQNKAAGVGEGGGFGLPGGSAVRSQPASSAEPDVGAVPGCVILGEEGHHPAPCRRTSTDRGACGLRSVGSQRRRTTERFSGMPVMGFLGSRWWSAGDLGLIPGLEDPQESIPALRTCWADRIAHGVAESDTTERLSLSRVLSQVVT